MIEKYDPEKLVQKLAAYRDWIAGRELKSGECVQYCGVECMSIIEVPLKEVEQQITVLMEDALYVDWAEQNSVLYLRVWEHGGPEPEWSKVFAHENLADVAAILREAGFDME